MKHLKLQPVLKLTRVMAIGLIITFGCLGGSAAQAVSPGDVVINEIMRNPAAVSDTDGEWFEVFNLTDSPIDINGWTIEDDDIDSHVINNGGPLNIPAGGFLVLGRNADTGTNGAVTVDYEYSSFILANAVDEVVLLQGTIEIDRVEYDGGTTFPAPNGASMALRDPASDNNVGENWCESTTPFGDGDLGTPGTPNICSNASPCDDLISFAQAFGTTDSDTDYNLSCDSEPDGDVDGVDLSDFLLGYQL